MSFSSPRICGPVQLHVHEVLGSVEIAERNCDPHNHRFVTITGQQIGNGINHIHPIRFRTDFFEDHFHEFNGFTGRAIPIADGRHVHFLKSITTRNDDHRHEFRLSTLIEDPIGDKCY